MIQPTTIEPELMKKKDVAQLLQVSGRQIELLVKAGRLPEPLRLSNHPRWRRSQLLEFLDSLSQEQAGK